MVVMNIFISRKSAALILQIYYNTTQNTTCKSDIRNAWKEKQKPTQYY